MGHNMSSQADYGKAAKSIRFHFYGDSSSVTRRTEIVCDDVDSVGRTTYNTVYPLTLLVHGFNNTFEGSFLQDTKNALLRQKVQTNVIMMDYRELSRVGLFNFPEIIPFVPLLSERLVDFLLFLTKSGLLSSPENVHLVGESLGAQICGLAGKRIQEVHGQKIRRITGLDPAGESEKERLCPSDAQFVDVVHSNQGVMGYVGSIGHVDWYLNGGGPIQPKYKDRDDNNWMGLDRDDLSHAFAVELFTESIQKEQVIKGCGCIRGKGICNEFSTSAESCPKMGVFGYYTPSSTRGEYYVQA